ncbi:O-fucosyltransferase family protein [Abeliophyllum distichum]|uniref:O-fucosyltransferase family protein n=1 Tax=Abeliophyllum distichum TaxID=126358 RepID=A0ABD1VZT9_9LAMI
MEVVRSDRGIEKLAPLQGQMIQRTRRIQVWFIRVCSCILVWACLFQIVSVGELWRPRVLTGLASFTTMSVRVEDSLPSSPPSLVPARNYTSNGFLKVSCNGGLNQMRAAICDMVTIARLLNLTLVVPELDKTSFWADHSNFEDIFDVRHFIDSLRDEVRIIKRLPKRFSRRNQYQPLVMPPVSWSNEKYYLEQILPLFNKHRVIHFNKTDARLVNNGIPIELQRLRCCTHGCTEEEAEELKRLRYAFPRWREKEIVSEERRSQGLCPLTPEETALILQALGEWRLAALRSAFPRIVKKEMLLGPEDLRLFRNHSSQMAALDFMVSVASNIFIPTYDGNMARVVEGHRRYLGFRKTIQLNRKRLVELLDLHQNGTLSWDKFSVAVRLAHERRMGQPAHRRVIADKPKEEDYFYANPQECFCESTSCDDLLGPAKDWMDSQTWSTSFTGNPKITTELGTYEYVVLIWVFYETAGDTRKLDSEVPFLAFIFVHMYLCSSAG